MTMAEWANEAKKLDDAKLESTKKAINTLLSWTKFKEEWNWTGLEALAIILGGEMSTRARAAYYASRSGGKA